MADRSQSGASTGIRICEVCIRNTADFYCGCSGANCYFCSGCFPAHMAQFSGLEHRLVRADAESPEVAACRVRTQAFAAGRTELLQNLATIDQCCLDLIAMVQSMVQTLNTSLYNQLTHLNALKATLKADIEESVREVESTLTARQVELRGKYSVALRSHEQGRLVLFNYRLDPKFVDSCCLSLPTFALSDPGQIKAQTEPQLVHLEKGSRDKAYDVAIFDFETETWRPDIRLSTPVDFDTSSKYTCLNANQVFCCGFIPASTTNWLIDFVSGQVEQLPPLSVPRSNPGVLHHEGELFVFGHGRDKDVGRAVEMLQLASPRWNRLPDMNSGRCSFSPCVYKSNAYLCCAKDSSIDIMELQTRRFLAPLSINQPQEQFSYAAVAVIGDELVIISEYYTTTFNLLHPETSSSRHEPMFSVSSTPVKHGNLIYWVNVSGRCICAKGEKWENVRQI